MEKASKRFIAILMSFIICLQTILPGLSVYAWAASGSAFNLLNVDGVVDTGNEKYFKRLTLSIPMASEEDGKDDQIRLDFQVQLDEWETLYGTLQEKVESGEIRGFDEFNRIEDYYAYLNDLDESVLPSLSFKVTFDPKQFTIDTLSSLNGEVKTNNNATRLGKWFFEKTDSDGITFSMTIDKTVYYMTNVRAEFTARLGATEDIKKGDSFKIEKGSDYTVEITKTGSETVATPSDAYVTLDKEGQGGTSGTRSLYYTIMARSYGAADGSQGNFSDLLSDASSSDAEYKKATASTATLYNAQEGDASLVLEGAVISDTIPGGLSLNRLEVNGRKAEEAGAEVGEEDLPSGYYQVVPGGGADGNNGDIIKYKVDSNDIKVHSNESSRLAESVELKLYFQLSDEEYSKYLSSSYGYKRTFYNKAEMKLEAGGEEESIVSQIASVDLELPAYFTKEGRKVGASGTAYQWDIYVNSEMEGWPDSSYVYIVDSIKDVENAHHYRKDVANENDFTTDPVTIYRRYTDEKLDEYGSSDFLDEAAIKKLLEKADLDSSKSPSYADLCSNGMEMKTAVSYANALTGNGNNCVYYLVDGEAGTTDAVMLIPIPLSALSKPLRISYQTHVEFADIVTDEHVKSKELENVASPIYDFSFEGAGPWGEFNFIISADKKINANNTLVSKTGGSYDPFTQTMPWVFTVNEYGAAMDKLVLEDTLDGEDMKFTEAIVSEHKDMVLNQLDAVTMRVGSVGRMVPYADAEKADEMDAAKQDHYCLDDSQTGQKLTIYLYNIGPEDCYTFTIDTVIVNSDWLSDDGTEKSAENTVNGAATIKGTVEPIEVEAVGSGNVKNQLLEKIALPITYDVSDNSNEEGWIRDYDYDKNRVRWKIAANGEYIPVKGAVITDSLPEGHKVARDDGKPVFEVSRIAKHGAAVEEGTITSGNDANAGTVTFDAGQSYEYKIEENTASDSDVFTITAQNAALVSTEELTILLDTEVTEKYRKEHYKTNVGEEEFFNKVQFKGIVVANDEKAFDLFKEAKHIVDPKPIRKEGVKQGDTNDLISYKPIDGVDGDKAACVTWRIWINRNRVDFNGITLKDEFEDYMEFYKPDDIKLYNASIDESGKETAGDEISGNDRNLFHIKGIDGVDNDYTSGFQLTIPESYKDKMFLMEYTTYLTDSSAVIANSVDIEGSDEGQGDSSDATLPDASFDMEDYAVAYKIPCLGIMKISANTQQGEVYPLKGAKFTLTPVNYEASSDRITDVPNGKVLKKITKDTGKASFMFLQPNQLYELEETVFPDGYSEDPDNAGKTTLVAFMKNDGLPAHPDKNNESYICHYYNLDDNVFYGEPRIENIPGGSSGSEISLSVKKTGIHQKDNSKTNKQFLDGVEFTLIPNSNSLVSITKKTDAAGIIKFEKLDPGVTYTLREKKPAGYKADGSYQISFKKGNDGNYETIVTNGGNSISLDGEGNLAIVNVENTKSAAFKKVNQNGDDLSASLTEEQLKTIKFDLYRYGSGNMDGNGNANVIYTVDNYLNNLTELKDIIEDSNSWHGFSSTEGNGANVYSLNEEGLLKILDLPIGDYKLVEQSYDSSVSEFMMPGNTETIVTFRISENGSGFSQKKIWRKIDGAWNASDSNQTTVPIPNNLKYGQLLLNKVGAEQYDRDKIYPLKDITFEIYKPGTTIPFITLKTDADGKLPEPDADGFYTDSVNSGKKKALVLGEYTIKEKANSNDKYNYFTTPVSFEVTKDNRYITISYDGTGENGIVSYAKTKPTSVAPFTNGIKRGAFHIKKIGDSNTTILSGAEFEISSDKEGKKILAKTGWNEDEKIYQLKKPETISGDTSEYKAGDVPLAYYQGDQVHLLPGTYYITETVTPENYTGLSEPKKVEVTANEWNTASTSIKDEEVEIQNSLKSNQIKLQKLLEEDVTDSKAGFKFILKGEDVEGTSIQKEEDSNESGDVSFDTIPIGTYKVYEVPVDGKTDNYQTISSAAADGIHLLDVEVKEAGVTYTKIAGTGEIAVEIENGEPTVTNKIKRGAITGSKQVSSGEYSLEIRNTSLPLKGAEFALFKNSGDSQPISWSWAKAVSDENGSIAFENVPYGTYYIKETKSPDGYAIINSKEPLTVNNTNISLPNPFYNTPNRGDIKLDKRGSYPNENLLVELKDAVFTVYTDQDCEDTPIAEISFDDALNAYTLKGKPEFEKTNEASLLYLKSDASGKLKLLTGAYWLKETKAPEGFRKDSSVTPFTVEKDKETVISNEPDNEYMVNMPLLAALAFEKQSETPTQAGEGDLTSTEDIKFKIGWKGEADGGKTLAEYLESIGQGALLIDDEYIVKTDQNGKVLTTGLPRGTYLIEELGLDAQDCIWAKSVSNSSIEVTIDYDDQDKLAVSASDNVDFQVQDDDQTIQLNRKDSDGQPSAAFVNYVIRGSIQGKKMGGSNLWLPGAEFQLYTKDDQNSYQSVPGAVAVTDRNGQFLFENILMGIYYVKESQAPDEYMINPKYYEVEVEEHNKIVTNSKDTDDPEKQVFIIKNDNSSFGFSFEKKGFITDTDGNRVIIQEILSNAQFTVYAQWNGTDDVPVALMSYDQASGAYELEALTDQNDKRPVSESKQVEYVKTVNNREQLILDNNHPYYMVETTTPSGYQKPVNNRFEITPSKDGGSYIVSITGENAETEQNKIIIYNQRHTSGFSIKKTIEEYGYDFTGTEGGAGNGFVFLISSPDHSKLSHIPSFRTIPAYQEDSAGGVLVTADSLGEIEIMGLPVGTYTITEVDGPQFDTYMTNQVYTVTVAENGNEEFKVTYHDGEKEAAGDIIPVHNTLIRKEIQGKKTDDSDEARPLPGAEFGIFKVEDDVNQETAETMTLSELQALSYHISAVSEQDGTYAFSDIPCGTYVIAELSAPSGYVTGDFRKCIVVDKASQDIIMIGDAANRKITSQLKIFKQDADNPYKILDQVIFDLFAETDDERICSLVHKGNGVYMLPEPTAESDMAAGPDGEPYLRRSTGINGEPVLTAGNYYVVETNPMAGYLNDLDQSSAESESLKKHQFTVSEDGKTVVLGNDHYVTDDSELVFTNEKARGSFDIVKTKEVNGGEDEPGKGFRFLVTWEPVEGLEHEVISDFANVLVDGKPAAFEKPDEVSIIVTTGSDGKAALTHLLEGTYTVKELEAEGITEMYVIDAQSQAVTVSVGSGNNVIVDKKTASFHNSLKRGTISGIKTDQSEKGLEGARIGLFPADTDEFKEENLYHGLTAVSSANGSFTFEEIPYGRYVIAELEAPSGYKLNQETRFAIKIWEHGQIVTTDSKGLPLVFVNQRKSSGRPGNSSSPKPGVTAKPELPTVQGMPEGKPPFAPPENPESVEQLSITRDTEGGAGFSIKLPHTNGGTIYIMNESGTQLWEVLKDEQDVIHITPDESWKPGNYYIFEDGVPLARFLIEDENAPLAGLPKVGDKELPSALLAAVFLAVLGIVTDKKKRRNYTR